MNVSQETCRYFTVSDFRDEKGDGGIDCVHLKPSLKEVAVVFLLAMDTDFFGIGGVAQGLLPNTEKLSIKRG